MTFKFDIKVPELKIADKVAMQNCELHVETEVAVGELQAAKELYKELAALMKQ